jgi:hypothetical protein
LQRLEFSFGNGRGFDLKIGARQITTAAHGHTSTSFFDDRVREARNAHFGTDLPQIDFQ